MSHIRFYLPWWSLYEKFFAGSAYFLSLSARIPWIIFHYNGQILRGNVEWRTLKLKISQFENIFDRPIKSWLQCLSFRRCISATRRTKMIYFGLCVSFLQVGVQWNKKPIWLTVNQVILLIIHIIQNLMISVDLKELEALQYDYKGAWSMIMIYASRSKRRKYWGEWTSSEHCMKGNCVS